MSRMAELHAETRADVVGDLEAEIACLTKALKAASGYLLNAKIDLETGAPKRTAVATIDGGLQMIREALGTERPQP